jgi:hypothetical protein
VQEAIEVIKVEFSNGVYQDVHNADNPTKALRDRHEAWYQITMATGEATPEQIDDDRADYEATPDNPELGPAEYNASWQERLRQRG